MYELCPICMSLCSCIIEWSMFSHNLWLRTDNVRPSWNNWNNLPPASFVVLTSKCSLSTEYKEKATSWLFCTLHILPTSLSALRVAGLAKLFYFISHFHSVLIFTFLCSYECCPVELSCNNSRLRLNTISSVKKRGFILANSDPLKDAWILRIGLGVPYFLISYWSN